MHIHFFVNGYVAGNMQLPQKGNIASKKNMEKVLHKGVISPSSTHTIYWQTNRAKLKQRTSS